MDLSRFSSILPPSIQPIHVLAAFGAYAALRTSLRVLDFIWLYFLRPSRLNRYKHGSQSTNVKDQPWALVTGSSDGIGLGFAEELCSRGFNVIIHGRNADKLAGVRKQLLAQWPTVQVRVAVQDAGEWTDASMNAMLAALDGLNITVLVNNVGGAPPNKPIFLPYDTMDLEHIDGFIAINTRFTLLLTNKFLARLGKKKDAGPALIINTGSLAGGLPFPYMPIYCGAKGFLASWGNSLSYEMFAEGRDVEIMTINTGEVRNQMDPSPPRLMRPSGRTYARSALHKVGSGRSFVTPYPGHALLVGFMGAMPQVVTKPQMIAMAKGFVDQEAKKA